ncbi:Potential protein lysine methyltransferase SET5 (SET domain-containing protein 5) [Durusdinium trenchii]|uniref:Potential protein lysine methyltransferase SET5 (SET domain-containing protein 5) n=1 Tax=Durusdinium trenchii TaxID=1381693 RepID=A0ABP0QUD1_9DINO
MAERQAAMGEAPAEQLQTLKDVLLRWEANRFVQQRPPNDADDELRELRFAVFAQVSRLNHSCAPSADVGYVFQPFQSGSAVPDDGKSVVRAMRDLDAGEALEINYGPPQLLEWPLARRREFLQAQNGFLCQCRRCRDEANAQRREDP